MTEDSFKAVGNILRDMLGRQPPEYWPKLINSAMQIIREDADTAQERKDPGFEMIAEGLPATTRFFGALFYAEKNCMRLAYYQIPRDQLEEFQRSISPGISLTPDADGWVGMTNGVPIRVGDDYDGLVEHL